VWQAFLSSDLFGQSIVLILGIGSVVSWSLMVYKLWELKQVKQASGAFIARFRRTERDPFSLSVASGANPDPASRLYSRARKELLAQVESEPAHGCLTRRGIGRVEETMAQVIEEEETDLKKWMMVLGSLASAGPMLGILGTVYGVLIAFMGMGESRGATIDAVAPGIAGALTTTVAGLLVAIPALIGYNCITRQIDGFSGSLYRFASEVSLAAEDAFPPAGSERTEDEE